MLRARDQDGVAEPVVDNRRIWPKLTLDSTALAWKGLHGAPSLVPDGCAPAAARPLRKAVHVCRPMCVDAAIARRGTGRRGRGGRRADGGARPPRARVAGA